MSGASRGDEKEVKEMMEKGEDQMPDICRAWQECPYLVYGIPGGIYCDAPDTHRCTVACPLSGGIPIETFEVLKKLQEESR